MTQNAFVTGSTGFVGSNLVSELVAQGWQVTALTRADSPREDIELEGVRFAVGDITDPASLAAAIPRGVDAVFHVAASTSQWSHNNRQQTLVNVDGTRNVMEAAISAGAGRMVHTSSFVVWGFVDEILTEDTRAVDNDNWINYVYSKRQAEELVKQAVADSRIDACICNPAHILGPGDRHNWSRMIRMVNQGKLPGVPPGGGAFADVREVAKAHITAYHRGGSGRNYILGGEDEMFIDVIRMTGEILSKKVPASASKAWVLRAAGRANVMLAAITRKEPDITPESAAMITRHLRCNSSRAMQELDYRFTPVRDLLEDTCAWMQEKGLLE